MKTYMGVSAGFHDAGVSVINDNGDILFAGHSERYSKVKNDATLNEGIISAALEYGDPDVIAWYERPWLKKTRQLYSGEWRKAFSELSPRKQLTPYFDNMLLSSPGVDSNPTRTMQYHSHHLSHAAAGFQTSPFDRAIVVVVDAIGEWDTYSVYEASYEPICGFVKYKPLMRQRYPHSLGLFYSAMTQRAGLKPMEEEYILMGMAAYGTTEFYRDMYDECVDKDYAYKWKRNFHIGVEDNFLEGATNEDIATAAQMITERAMETLMRQISEAYPHIDDCVFMGGVALNCVANSRIRDQWNRVWIMPNPGDCGSSLGAAALSYGKKLNWEGPYLGTDIPGEYPCANIVSELINNKIVGVASGRAEFGPRALGNRSLLADPRGRDIKDMVNNIKRRQKFRPFAPMVLKEFAKDHFDMPQFDESPYMQFTYKCTSPREYPAITHADQTSRVQTVSKHDKTGARELLEMWYTATGCPMLLNTSLNIRGEPMVDDRTDADRFEKKYGVTVCS